MRKWYIKYGYSDAEGIKTIFQMVEKADKTIEVMTGEIKQYQDERARSKSG